ncbi:MAG TPA: hypothetical protein VKA51_03775 [Rubrobacteraceae bacterium]|nr:hypothetical protein [Rubrobacteraceae bacterium]
MEPEHMSHKNTCSGEIVTSTFTLWYWLKYPNAAATTHMNAVAVADVPAVWSRLFIKRLLPRVRAAATCKNNAPRNAESKLALNPSPSLSTMYGYESATTDATTNAPTSACHVNSGNAAGRANGVVGSVLMHPSPSPAATAGHRVSPLKLL